jgi:hypothetical protein
VTKFLVLYHSPVSSAEQMASMTPEQAKEGMDLWMSWAGRTGEGLVEFGMPLGDAMTVTPDGASPSKGHVTGYSIIQAESLDEAVNLVKDHPHFHAPKGSAVEVIEFAPMPGM